jgi:hypothetical protein
MGLRIIKVVKISLLGWEVLLTRIETFLFAINGEVSEGVDIPVMTCIAN